MYFYGGCYRRLYFCVTGLPEDISETFYDDTAFKQLKDDDDSRQRFIEELRQKERGMSYTQDDNIQR